MTDSLRALSWDPHWVYRMFDAEGELLYIGCTSGPRSRLLAWRSVANATPGHWFEQVADIRWVVFGNKAEAASEERRAIRTESPRHNIAMASPRRAREINPEREDRAARMVRAYVHDDLTLEQIGQRHGVTRERVRQIINKTDPTIYRLAKMRRKARTRHRRAMADGFSELRHCRLCGGLFEAGGLHRRFCSPVHQAVHTQILRYQIDAEHRETHYVYVARWNAKSEDPKRRTHGERVLAGEATRRGKRWLVPGSLAFHWAVRAYVLDWPVWEQFHPDVQAQVRAHISGEAMAS